jgi:hypothetical protein
MTNLREKLAELAHEQWSGWMRWMFRCGKFVAMRHEGVFQTVWIMPGALRERWERQMKSPYSELPEREKDSDRVEADRMMSIALEDAARVVEWYLSHYSASVFVQPEPGQHGKTVDACSAAALREVLPHIADDIRKLAAPQPGRAAARVLQRAKAHLIRERNSKRCVG